jgi:hypothetical protein
MGDIFYCGSRAGRSLACHRDLERMPGMNALLVKDKSLAGGETGRMTLEFPTERITVRELIRERVYQEVQDYNRRKDEKPFNGLVRPEALEVKLNGPREMSGPTARREINWKVQYEKACEAFERNRVLVLVGEKQAEGLEEMIELGRGVEVSFLKLVPLVGG